MAYTGEIKQRNLWLSVLLEFSRTQERILKPPMLSTSIVEDLSHLFSDLSSLYCSKSVSLFVFSDLSFQFVFFDLYLPICMFQFYSVYSELYFCELYLSIVTSEWYFRISYLYFPMCTSRCVISDFITRIVFSNFYFPEVKLPDLYFSINSLRIMCSGVYFVLSASDF